MPNEQKLILSNASGTSPDVVLGVNYWTPFDFAARDAAKDLTEYDDFLEFYAEQYNLESLVPLFYNGGVYGATGDTGFPSDVLPQGYHGGSGYGGAGYMG